MQGMSVLCATDFGEEAGRAAEVAAAVARRIGEPLVLVHAFMPPEIPFDGEPGAQMAALEAAAEASMTFERVRLAPLLDRIEIRTVFGSPESVVPRIATHEDARLIVCGAHNRAAPARWLLGSTAARLSRVSPSPVLVVRGPIDGFLAWGRNDRPLHVLVAFDLDETFDAEMDFAEGLLEAGPCELEFLHAAGGPSVREAEFARLASDERSVHLVHGSPAEEVGRLVANGRFDLVVVGTHARKGTSRLWHPSIAERILRRSPTPVAVARMGTSLRPPAWDGAEISP